MRERPQELYGIPINEIARICRVSVKTATRWKDGTTCPPKSAMMLLAGDLGCFDPSWAGWLIRHGKLISPESLAHSPGQILAIAFMELQIQGYRSELRQMKAALNSLEEQPLPGTIPDFVSSTA